MSIFGGRKQNVFPEGWERSTEEHGGPHFLLTQSMSCNEDLGELSRKTYFVILVPHELFIILFYSTSSLYPLGVIQWLSINSTMRYPISANLK